MLLRVLTGEGEIGYKILHLLISIIALLPALTFHEWAHGYAAYKLGDSTAKADGRLSLNPLDHIDPMGALMMLFVGFGWAKPVPVMTRNFKKPRRDFAIVSLAGPFSNLVLGFLTAMLYGLTFYICSKFEISNATSDVIQLVFLYSTLYNIGLGLFNLIPFPPLDGSNILICCLPNRWAAKYSRVRFYTHYIFLAIIIAQYLPYPISAIPDLLFTPLNWLRDLIVNAFFSFADFVFHPMFF